MKTPIALLLLCVAAASPARPQTDSLPGRPRLTGGDTNDAQAYYTLGMERMSRSAREAAAAFYWAMRLDPECAGCVYGRAIASLLEDDGRLRRYWFGDPAVRTMPKYRAIDSLRRRSLMMDPFLFRRLDAVLLAGVAGVLGTRDWERRFEEYLMEDSSLAARVLYSKGRFRQAAGIWGALARANPRDAFLRVERARTYYLLQHYDSARIDLTEALRLARAEDADSTRFIYESKAAWEYSLGRIHQATGALDSARAAFERAIIEELTYAPAHVQLGLIHIERRDTATALREFARAVAIKDDEYLPHLTYAFFLATAGQLDSAETHAARSAELEPFAARPRFMLGVVRDARGDAAGALSAFDDFLARAARNDQDRPAVVARMAELQGARR